MNKEPIYYLQTDSRWKNNPYQTSAETATIGGSGCGPTCAAMLIETLTGKTYTPVDACKWSMNHGYKATNQGTYYSYFVPQFKLFNIDCKMLNSNNVYGDSNASVHKEAFDLLKQGYYLIACMGKGLWTSSGHFIVVWWEDGKVRINDPASKQENRINGDLKTFKSQVKYYWAIDARDYNSDAEDIDTSTKKIISIPLSNIERIQFYVNKNKKSLTSIMAETGADYGINGGLYNSNWTPCPLLKVDGKMVSTDPYTMWGYGYNEGPDITMSNSHKTFQNYIGCVDLMNPWTGSSQKLSYDKALGGKRGRTAIGLRRKELVLYCSKDGSTNAKTPEALREELVDFGCETAVMLDGGGSSQIRIKNGSYIYTSRNVHNYILVYLKGNKGKTPVVDTRKEKIKEIQSELNRRYGFNLVVDGSWGPASKKVFIMAIQKEVGVTVDGSFGPKTRAACPVLKKGSTGNLVWLLQAALYINGQVMDLDGSFGPGTYNAVKAFQKSKKLAQDGLVGPATWTVIVK